jgi:nonspecific dipeptidase
VQLPPVILGSLGNDPEKPVVCIYGHLDVQPAAKEDGWATDPFKLVEKDGKLYGRGSSDDKGPVLGWLHAIEAYQKTKQDIPVNLKVRSTVKSHKPGIMWTGRMSCLQNTRLSRKGPKSKYH